MEKTRDYQSVPLHAISLRIPFQILVTTSKLGVLGILKWLLAVIGI